jgi:hypothetical protein
MNLLRFGVGLAQQSDSQVLTLDILAAAFDKRLAKHVKKTNPFTVLPDQHFTPPLHAPLGHDDPNSTNNRSRRRKKRELKASDVLRTA